MNVNKNYATIKLQLAFIAVILFSHVFAQEIEITKKNYSTLKIAINYAEINNIKEQKYSDAISSIISTNLANSGLFTIIDPAKFIQHTTKCDTAPIFSAWKQSGATLLLNSKIYKTESNHYKMQVILWDVILGTKLMNKTFSFHKNAIKRVGNIISDSVYLNATGEEGCFDTKIAYVAEDIQNQKKITRIAIMDQDGTHHRYLTNGEFITISPKISQDNRQIAYVDFRHRISKVFVRCLYSGEEKLLCNVKGNVFAPTFSKDGQEMLFSKAHRGATNIYKINIKTKKIKELTKNGCINTCPSYSPDNKSIVFISDRSESNLPQIYSMNIDGKNVKRISSGYSYYSSPAWSPKGNLIAAIKIVQKRFYLALIDIDTGKEQIIAHAPIIHGFCWAPNGRYIVFSREEKSHDSNNIPQYKLYKIDISGTNEVLVETPYNASDPNWSQLHQKN